LLIRSKSLREISQVLTTAVSVVGADFALYASQGMKLSGASSRSELSI
jgi:hypothetical protein